MLLPLSVALLGIGLRLLSEISCHQKSAAKENQMALTVWLMDLCDRRPDWSGSEGMRQYWVTGASSDIFTLPSLPVRDPDVNLLSVFIAKLNDEL